MFDGPKFTITPLDNYPEHADPTQEGTGLFEKGSGVENRRLLLISAYENFLLILKLNPKLSDGFLVKLNQSEREILDYLLPFEDVHCQVFELVTRLLVSASTDRRCSNDELLDKSCKHGLTILRMRLGLELGRDIPHDFFKNVNAILIEMNERTIRIQL
jgi:hypothetical protein